MNATRKLFHTDTLSAWETNAAIIGLRPHRLPFVVEKVNQNGPIPEHRPELGPCWEWTASRKGNGYGQYNDRGRNWNAHRLVFLLNGGTIPEDYELDHECRNRGCVNPSHLEPVTHAENVRRQGASVTVCVNGHPYTEENTYRWRGLRHCRACRENQSAAQSAKRKASRALMADAQTFP